MPYPSNEPVNSYAPGTIERDSLLNKYKEMYNQKPIHVPLYIGGEEIETETKLKMSPPHDHNHTLGHFSVGTKEHVQKAIDSALAAREAWSSMPWEHRATIFLKAGVIVGQIEYGDSSVEASAS